MKYTICFSWSIKCGAYKQVTETRYLLSFTSQNEIPTSGEPQQVKKARGENAEFSPGAGVL
jgi:hypothetical protein